MIRMWTPKKIKELRKAYGDTQEQFAERFRVSLDTVRGWEQGRWPVSGMASVILDDLQARCPEEAKVG